ncbi:putative dehydrogenase [Rhizobium sp. BK313]|uniref:Gfo/Idh/MocA family protein n=1 Tax=Rhizobium sp. BK313 TaxID=2587081 RepID=UPI001060B52D|nr:Gfo/Idh/MocA family oxidoreductase [Rhizobium sp. BK313]MBB3458295.1 putative dehydrogenase [Rhizobium sp. BK313]
MSKNRIRVGIVGVHPDKGWAATGHIPALRLLPEYEITTISHHERELANAAAEKFGIKNAVATTEELVSRRDVDLVVISVKVPRHLDLVTQAINAGKSVLCEWPLGINLADAAKMNELAKTKGVHAAVGLQTRSAPAINFVRDLVREGYVGTVRSSTLIGSGIIWGDSMNEMFKYTLDPQNGAGMLRVPFGHSVDAVLYALDSRFAEVSGTLASVRKTTRIIETGQDAPMGVPDQIAVSGVLESGVFINIHFRGGLSRATNFHWEINGSEGDIVVTTPVGYIGAGGYQVRGAQGDDVLRQLDIPSKYGDDRFEIGIPQSMAVAYQRLASDILTGTRLCPTFEDAIALHRLLADIESSDRSAHHV